MELYSYAACPFAQRTRMVLAEKGIDYTLTEIDVYNKPEGWEKISPYGKVPCLTHDGGTIYESTIINEYLDETFPEPPLMPADPMSRAQARIWIDYCENRFLKTNYTLMRELKDAEKLEQNRENVYASLRFIEHEGMRKLSDGPFWFGDRPMLIDFQYLPFFERFPVYQELAGIEWPEDCTRLTAWLKAMSEQDSVRPAMRSREYHLEQQRNRQKAMNRKGATSPRQATA